MNLKEWRLIYLTIYILAVGGILYPVVKPLLTETEGTFLSMTILGNSNSTGDYFHSDESTANQGEEVKWKIRIYNGLKDPVYLSIKIKFTDQNTTSPNIDTCTPLDAPTIFVINRILINSEIVEFPFTWEVGDIEIIDNEYTIKSLIVNDKMVNTNVVLYNDFRAKLIFEVWKYDVETNKFEFTIDDGKEEQCIWNQINFNMGN
jgi:hypothetical protein